VQGSDQERLVIIAVEGLDGVGKTAVSRILAERLDATYVALPPPELLLRAPDLFRRYDSLARYLYYLSGVAATAAMVRPDTPLVADRYLASAHALHLDVSGQAADILRDLPLPSPTLTLYLTADERSRRTRLSSRNTPLDPFEQALNENESFREAVAERLRSAPGTHVIDTTGRLPADVADIAMKIWDRTRQGGRDGG
jgi:thymidylate kinase